MTQSKALWEFLSDSTFDEDQMKAIGEMIASLQGTLDAQGKRIAELEGAIREMCECYSAQPKSEKDIELSARKINAYFKARQALANTKGETDGI